jgi:hypothetical protein
MKGNHLKWFGSLLVVAFLNMSCAGTGITPEYTDDTFTGKVSNILVIALTGSELHQRNFEKAIVSQLKSAGVDAVSSAEVMALPEDLILTKEMILGAIKKHGNDAVIITQLIDRQNEDTYRRGSNSLDYYGYYRTGRSYLNAPRSKNANTTTVLLETKLFDVKTEKLIWAGTSETLGRDPEDGEMLWSMVEALVDELQSSQLIPR